MEFRVVSYNGYIICKLSFKDNNTYVAISNKGKYFKASFDPEKVG